MLRNDRQGFTLLEVTIATAIVGLMCAGVLSLMVTIDARNRQLHDRVIAVRACHQMMEIEMAKDLDSMLLDHANSFEVLGMSRGSTPGTITISDLNWNGANNAYLIRLEVPSLDVVLEAVRTRT